MRIKWKTLKISYLALKADIPNFTRYNEKELNLSVL